MTKQSRTLTRLHCGGLGEALVYLKKNITKAKNVDSNPESFLFILQKVIVTGNSLLTSKFVINNETNPEKYQGRIPECGIPQIETQIGLLESYF